MSLPLIKRSRAPAGAATALKFAELGVAAPQVIGHRLSRMAMAGFPLNARDQKEFTGMVAEKQLAFSQAWMSILMEGWRLQQRLMFGWLTMATPQQSARQVNQAAQRMLSVGVAPLHRKAVANAKRLGRTQLR